MEKKIGNLSKLADDIALSEQDERKLFNAYKTKIESRRKKKNFMRIQYRVAAVAFAVMIVFLTAYCWWCAGGGGSAAPGCILVR